MTSSQHHRKYAFDRGLLLSGRSPNDSAESNHSYTATTLLGADDVRRALARIAHEILERTHGAQDVVLVGLHTEGVPLAQRLAVFIQGFEKLEVPVGQLDFAAWRDDVQLRNHSDSSAATVLPVDVTGKTVILVDDVLYTGRSLRAAMTALLTYGRPARIQAAVLVDRGHRELPIRADYVGKNLPTHKDEWIRVFLQELHGRDSVVLLRQEPEDEGDE